MRRVRRLTPALEHAYRASTYVVGDVALHVGRHPSGALPWEAFVVLGACNPGGRRSPDAVNARMMHALERRLGRHKVRPARGGLGRWWEAMLAAPIAPARAVLLARMFGQNAILCVRSGARVRLLRV